MFLQNKKEIENAISLVYLKSSSGKLDGKDNPRPIVISVLDGGWDKDYKEAAFLICGSPNRGRGFVKQDWHRTPENNKYCVTLWLNNGQKLYGSIVNNELYYLADETDSKKTKILVNNAS